MSNATDPYIDLDSSVEIDYSNEEALLNAAAAVDRSPSPAGMTRSLGMDLKSMVTLVETHPLQDGRYFKTEGESIKKQIYLHDTLGWGDPIGVINGWDKAKNSRGEWAKVGTWCLIAGRKVHPSHRHTDGHVYRAFSSRDWAYHLGVRAHNSEQLNRESIGIELCSFGPMVKVGENQYAPKAYPSLQNNPKYFLSEEDIVIYDESTGYPNGYRGSNFYEKYTDAQIEALRNTLMYLCDTYNIPTEYKGIEMFGSQESPYIDSRPFTGEAGIWTHTSIRGFQESKRKWEKHDCHPQPELINMLKSLSPVA